MPAVCGWQQKPLLMLRTAGDGSMQYIIYTETTVKTNTLIKVQAATENRPRKTGHGKQATDRIQTVKTITPVSSSVFQQLKTFQ